MSESRVMSCIKGQQSLPDGGNLSIPAGIVGVSSVFHSCSFHDDKNRSTGDVANVKADKWSKIWHYFYLRDWQSWKATKHHNGHLSLLLLLLLYML